MRKIKRWFLIFMLILSASGMSACGGTLGDGTVTETRGAAVTEKDAPATYEQISAEAAKALMDSEKGYIIIDARTDEEFAAGHIGGAILIPEYEIAERAESELPDKDALILVYCRSGRRSKIAAEELARLGYTNVKEFGGIIDWPYETVK